MKIWTFIFKSQYLDPEASEYMYDKHTEKLYLLT